ncbi:MAG TPA: FtsX-like permease family protein [Thermoleophilia bacterium]|nr:FtsX-like permease family protein [Thermoleophilia bacterium]
MVRIAWRSLTAHKLRSFLTTLAILLGVAMISGTYVLTDQIDRGFTTIFADAYQGIDATISRKPSFGGGQMVGATQGLPASLVDDVSAVEGVGGADGYINGAGAVAANGKLVQTGGAPTLFFSVSKDTIDNSSTYVQGGKPDAPGEVSIVEKLATDQGLSLGSKLTVITDTGSEDVTVAGIFRFGAESSLGGSLLVQSTLEDASRWFDMEGRVSQIDVQALPGTSPQTLVERIQPVLPDYAEAKTGEQAAADQTKAVSEAISQFLRPALLAFGGIAVLVGAFIIFNAFSMTVAQRRREFAMLRALGASRRQVLLVITGEALLMGALASVIGLFAGLGVAAGVNAIFKAAGIDIPRSGLVMEPRTVVVALVVGIVVTLLSAIAPALRATRVPPIAALQEGAVLPSSRFARLTPILAGLVTVLGIVLIVLGMYGSGSTTSRLVALAAGAVLVFVAVALVSKYFVGPVAAVLGWPLQKLSPISGRLARDNTQRNPARTAATASALMIGLGVVVFVAVFAQGLKSSFIDSVDKMVTADYVISGGNYLTLPADTTKRIEGVPNVDVAAGLNAQQVQVGGDSIVPLYGVDPGAFSRVWQMDWLDGDDALLGQLTAESTLVEEQTAASLGVSTGDTVSVASVDGSSAELKVLGVYRDPIMLNGLTVSAAAYSALFPKPQLFMVIAKRGANGDEAQTGTAIETALADTPTAVVETTEEYKESIVGMVNQLLNLLYGLLAMSVVISLFGIVNTLVLSVYERTREIGLLRAIGSSRRQVRSTVRYESVITSILGGVMGIVVGTVFAYVVTSRFGGQGITFSIPGVQLGVFLILAILVGVLAAILPARRAARIEILDAIHYE